MARWPKHLAVDKKSKVQIVPGWFTTPPSTGRPKGLEVTLKRQSPQDLPGIMQYCDCWNTSANVTCHHHSKHAITVTVSPANLPGGGYSSWEVVCKSRGGGVHLRGETVSSI